MKQIKKGAKNGRFNKIPCGSCCICRWVFVWITENLTTLNASSQKFIVSLSVCLLLAVTRSLFVTLNAWISMRVTANQLLARHFYLMFENVIRWQVPYVRLGMCVRACVCVFRILLYPNPPYALESVKKIIHKNVHVDVKRDWNLFVQNEIDRTKTEIIRKLIKRIEIKKWKKEHFHRDFLFLFLYYYWILVGLFFLTLFSLYLSGTWFSLNLSPSV